MNLFHFPKLVLGLEAACVLPSTSFSSKTLGQVKIRKALFIHTQINHFKRLFPYAMRRPLSITQTKFEFE